MKNIIFSFSLVVVFLMTTSAALKNFTKDSEALSIEVNYTSPTSSSTMDGKVKIAIKGGKAPYKLTVITSTRTTDQEYRGDNFEFSNLPKGFYMFNVYDAEGNFVTKNINL